MASSYSEVFFYAVISYLTYGSTVMGEDPLNKWLGPTSAGRRAEKGGAGREYRVCYGS